VWKLVRDRIPSILDREGVRYRLRKVESEDEYREYLLKKLREEVEEFAENPSEEELADILEVIDAIVVAYGFDRERIGEVKEKKLVERGGFREGVLVEILG